MPYRPSLVSPTLRPVLRPLVQQVFGYFDPLKLDPYLYFDTRESMVGTLENPTLDLDPSKPETLDVITATRSGTATYTDANGNIATAAADTVRVDYTQGEELTPTKFQRFVNTEFDQAYWAFSPQMGSPVYNYDTAPNGEQEAFRFVSNGGGFPQMIEYLTDLTIGQQYTASFYVKSDGTTQIQQSSHVTGAGPTVNFTPTNEWQRVSFTITATNTTHSFLVFTNSNSAPSSSFLIWGPQLEEGTTASDFVSNTTGSPKFIASATYGPRVPMILVEPSATNLLTATQEASSWSRTNVSVASNTTTAPDGSQTGDTVTRTAVDADVRQTKAVTSGTSYTMSIFAKAETDNQIQLDFSNSSMGADNVEFNTRTGQKVSGSANYSITQLSNGWRRYSFTSTCISSGNTGVLIRIENDEPVHLWGFQFEEGSVATSYIPHTSGPTVTRQADDLVISGSDFTDFYNSSEGTWYCEAVPKGNDGSENYTFLLEYGTANTDRVGFFYYVADGSLSVTGFNSNSQYYNQTKLGDSTNQLARLSYSYESGNHKSAINGTSDSDTDTVVPPANQLKLGKRIVGTNGSLVGHLKRVLFWPYHSDRL